MNNKITYTILCCLLIISMLFIGNRIGVINTYKKFVNLGNSCDKYMEDCVCIGPMFSFAY